MIEFQLELELTHISVYTCPVFFFSLYFFLCLPLSLAVNVMITFQHASTTHPGNYSFG